MSFRYILQAQFEDGFEYTGNAEDVSSTNPERNCFFDIREGLQAEHGRISRYSMLGLVADENGQYGTWNIDFTKLPADAKPIWFIRRERDFAINPDGTAGDPVGETRDMSYGFGYEFTNADGKVEKEIIEVT